MISVKDLRTLEVGDVIEAGTLFAGMTKEPLKLIVTMAGYTAQPVFKIGFKATYFDVVVGEYQVAVADEKAVWAKTEPLLALPAPEEFVP